MAGVLPIKKSIDHRNYSVAMTDFRISPIEKNVFLQETGNGLSNIVVSILIIIGVTQFFVSKLNHLIQSEIKTQLKAQNELFTSIVLMT